MWQNLMPQIPNSRGWAVECILWRATPCCLYLDFTEPSCTSPDVISFSVLDTLFSNTLCNPTQCHFCPASASIYELPIISLTKNNPCPEKTLLSNMDFTEVCVKEVEKGFASNTPRQGQRSCSGHVPENANHSAPTTWKITTYANRCQVRF